MGNYLNIDESTDHLCTLQDRVGVLKCPTSRKNNYNAEDNAGIRYFILVMTENIFLYEAKDVPFLYAFAYLNPETHEPQFYNPQSDDLEKEE